MAQTASPRFLGVKNPMAHYIPLWVIVVFTFFVVVICTMGGLQEGLAKRELPETKVNGDLEVTGDSVFGRDLSSKTGLVAPTSINTTVNTAAFTATYNTVHLLGASGGANVVITLPAPRVGASIKFITTAALANGTDWDIGVTATDPDFAIGSTLTSCSVAGAGPTGTAAVGAHGFNVLSIQGDSNGGGGIGSVVDLTGVDEAGTARWLVIAKLNLQTNASAADSSTFA